MKVALSFYNKQMKTHPVLTKSTSCGVIFALGDILAQQVENYTSQTKGIDLKRTFRMSFYGSLYVGPVMHVWYSKILPRFFPGTSLSHVLKKVCIDQTLMVTFMTSSFYTAQTLLENKTLENALDKVKHQLWPTLKTNWKVWPAIMALNFTLVPLDFQVILVNSVGIIWNAYLSYMQHRH